MRTLFLIIFLLPLAGFAQESLTIENGRDYNKAATAPFLNQLHNENDLVISFRVKKTNDPDEKSAYFILTSKENKLSAFNYSSERKVLTPLSLPESSLNLVWKTFAQNELLQMKDEKDISVFCAAKYEIFNSHTYEFEILSKTKMKKLSYYDPEYYDVACFGMDERKKIINSASVINYVLTENKKL